MDLAAVDTDHVGFTSPVLVMDRAGVVPLSTGRVEVLVEMVDV